VTTIVNRLAPANVKEVQLGPDCWSVICIPTAPDEPIWSIPFAYLNNAERSQVACTATAPHGVRDFFWLCNFDW
jgi:hypothetical protein